jgi:predicted nucleic acid-binding protein
MTAMGVKVVDASAAASILFNESTADAVAKKLSKSRLAAPSLLPYELANVAAKLCRQYPAKSEEFLSCLRLLDGMEIELIAVPPIEAATIAERTTLTAYDASYLWLAHNLNAELVTLDQKLAKKA